MKHSFAPHRFGIVGAMALLLGSLASIPAQPGAAPAVVETNQAEALNQPDLLQAYLHLQEQLHKAQLEIEAGRIEAKEYKQLAQTQAAAITETLTAIQSELNAQRVQRQNDLQKSNQTLLWVAAAFGGAGILAMLFTAMFQWRSVSRVAELSSWHPQLSAGAPNALLPAVADGTAGKAVELSNQRLMSVIERLERRVIELEQASPSSATEVAHARSDGEPAGPAARITLLLGKGQALLNEEQPELALECYNEILQVDAQHPEALVKKGAALERLKQDEEALRCYDRAIAADKTLTIAYLYKGGVYNRLERYNEALECYEQALRVQGHPA